MAQPTTPTDVDEAENFVAGCFSGPIRPTIPEGTTPSNNPIFYNYSSPPTTSEVETAGRFWPVDLNEATDEVPFGAVTDADTTTLQCLEVTPTSDTQSPWKDLNPIPIGCNSLCSLVAAWRTPVNKE